MAGERRALPDPRPPSAFQIEDSGAALAGPESRDSRVPFATDAKHTAALGIPTYGFSPLRLDPSESFMERFHGVNERVGVDALRWGLPVLYDVVRRAAG